MISKGEKAGDICFMFSLKITINPTASKLHREINSFMKHEQQLSPYGRKDVK